jgi:hypothetical protein
MGGATVREDAVVEPLEEPPTKRALLRVTGLALFLCNVPLRSELDDARLSRSRPCCLTHAW